MILKHERSHSYYGTLRTESSNKRINDGKDAGIITES